MLFLLYISGSIRLGSKVVLFFDILGLSSVSGGSLSMESSSESESELVTVINRI